MLTTLQQAKKLITFEQALSLKSIGYDLGVFYFYNYDPENLEVSKEYVDHLQGWNRLYNHNEILDGQVFPHKCSAPTISEALDWLREEKGIMCYVDIVFKPTTQKAYYIGKILSPSGLIIWRKTSYSDSHSLAESALLDEVMKYVEKN